MLINTTTALGKQHFEVLDGLRGIAALSVVLFHFCEFIYPKYPDSLVGHGYLAVDFFFCLSGFVISYAYDDRMAKMGMKQFFLNRIIRLHPMVVFGVILGLLAYLFDPFGGTPFSIGVAPVVITFFLSLFLIPGYALPDRFDNLFALNAPAWSLFWEYIANIFYALFLWRIKKGLLILLVVFAGITLFYVAFKSGTLSGGWGYSTFWDGTARISYSFLAGILVRRLDLRFKNPFGFISLSVLLIAAFAFPYFKLNWLAEALVVLFIFPLFIIIGSGVQVSGLTKAVCNFSGRLSYPLYMTHYSGIWAFGFYYAAYKPQGWPLFWIVAISMVVMVVVAWLVMRFFDEPVRAWLTNRKQGPSAQKA